MIGVVDYGAGNLANVQAALERLGARWIRVAQPADLERVSGVILPGVGRFGAALRALRAAGLDMPLRHFADAGKPFLGICLGMQALFEKSDEDPREAGLGILPGRVTKLDARPLPHIGWAVVESRDREAGSILRPLPHAFHAYFSHSYAVSPGDDHAAALTSCPPAFASAVRSGNVWGVQFHPEKSGAVGQALLASFVELARRGTTASTQEGDEARPAPAPPAGRARRIIPCLDIKDGRVVKGTRFRDLRDAGDPLERAAAYDEDGADEVCLLDVAASQQNRKPLYALVESVASRLTVPFTVGGGIRDLETMHDLLMAGADRVSIGTAAVEDPTLITRAARAFGRQFVIVSIDARRSGSRWEVTTHGGRRGAGREAVAWAREAEGLGAGEILLNAMDADGTRAGYDVPLTRSVARAVRVPVIASGGAGSPADMVAVLKSGEADAALAASVFHDGSVSIRQAKEEIRKAGVAVRL